MVGQRASYVVPSVRMWFVFCGNIYNNSREAFMARGLKDFMAMLRRHFLC